MLITIQKEKIQDLLGKVEKATGKNINFPILECIHLKAIKNRLVIKATNLEIGIEAYISAKTEKEGEVLIPAQTLVSYINQIQKNDDITLEENNGNLIISTNNHKATIKGVENKDFPEIPSDKEGEKVEINAEDFSKGIQSVISSAAVSSIKPELSSIYITSIGGFLGFVATDSFRLSEKQTKTKVSFEKGFLIPFKNASEISKILLDLKEEIEVVFDQVQVSIKTNNFRLVSRVFEGNFPNYNQIIPKNFSTVAMVLKQEIQNAVKISGIFADSFNQINIKINPKAGTFIVESKNNEKGEQVYKINCSSSGEEVELTFNSRYVTDCLQSINSDSVAFSFAGVGKPLVVRGANDNTFLSLIMPMNR